MENIVYVVATNSFISGDVDDITTVSLFLKKEDALFKYNSLKEEFLNEIQDGEYLVDESAREDELSFCAYLDGRYEEDHYTIYLWPKLVQQEATLEQKAYQRYLKEWHADHGDPEFEGMHPVCFNEFVGNEFEQSLRTCNECGKMHLKAGFVINGGAEYYCSEECLHKHYTEQEYLDLYDEGDGDSYWTEWEEEEEQE